MLKSYGGTVRIGSRPNKAVSFASASTDADTASHAPPVADARKFSSEIRNQIRQQFAKLPEVTISTVTYSIISSKEIRDMAVVNVTKFTSAKDLDAGSEAAIKNTVHDPRMGTYSASMKCETCLKLRDQCEGHPGIIDFEYVPGSEADRIRIPNPIALPAIITTLNNVCSDCATPLVSEDFASLNGFMSRNGYARAVALKDYILGSKEKRFCRYCSEPNPRNPGRLCAREHWIYKLGRSPFPSQPSAPIQSRWSPKDKSTHVYRYKKGTPIKDINPEYVPFKEIYKILSSITAEDARFLGFVDTHPANFMLDSVLVTPVNKRPPEKIDGRWAFDSLSEDFNTIVAKVARIHNRTVNSTELYNSFMSGLSGGARTIEPSVIEQQIDELYAIVSSMMIRNPSTSSNYRRKNLRDRLGGKTGYFRGNIQGKRVDYVARGPAGPAPDLLSTQVGVPMNMAKKLTYPEKVTIYNLDWLQSLLRQGEVTHIIPASGPRMGVNLPVTDEIIQSYELQVGDTARRWCQNGDPLIANRQPTLAKWGFLVLEAVRGDHYNIRMPDAIDQAYNLDHDGDEVNLHAPQTEESRAEALLVIHVQKNQFDDRTIKPMIKPQYDVNTGAYVLTVKQLKKKLLLRTVVDERGVTSKKVVEEIVSIRERYVNPGLFGDLWALITEPRPDPIDFFNRAFAAQMRFQVYLGDEPCAIKYFDNGEIRIGFYTEDGFKEIVKEGKPMFIEPSTRQLIFMKDGKEVRQKANIAWSGSTLFSLILPRDFTMSIESVVIENGFLKEGQMSKSTFADGPNCVLHRLFIEYGSETAMKFTNDISFIINRWLTEYGFSVGISDFLFAENEPTRKKIQDMINGAFSKIIKLGPEQEDPSKERFRNAKILQELNIATSVGTKIVEQDLDRLNPVYVMTKGAATKGGAANVANIGAGLMQQYDEDNIFRPTLADGERTLPYYPIGDRHPRYQGFVEHSYVDGLEPDEMIFHMRSSRKAMMASHTVLPTFGALRRLMARLCEDIKVGVDGSVRMKNVVLQSCYGGLGLSNRLVFVELNGKRIPSFIDVKTSLMHSLDGDDTDSEDDVE